MYIHELDEMRYAFGHAWHIAFNIWYDQEKIYDADQTEENKNNAERAKSDFELIDKGYKIFCKIKWEPSRISSQRNKSAEFQE